MKFIKNLKHNVFNLFVLAALSSCNTNSNFIDGQLNIPDTSKAEVIVLDSIINDTMNSDTGLNSISSLSNADSSLNKVLKDSKPLDSAYNLKDITVYVNNKPDLNKYIVGKWLVQKRVGNGEEKLGEQNVFAVYQQDSSFFMSAINVSGKWWISDTLLFQKTESSLKSSIDTSIIHLLNDTILEVLEIKRNYKFILKKVSK